MITLNAKADGYRGIWYMNQPTGDEYVFKYSGGLGTYCAKHSPFAVYCPAVEKTFFCYGGTTANSHLGYTAEDLREGRQLERPRPGFLLHMVSYFDHGSGLVPRPTILLDKGTADAHDNPVLAVDREGHLWIFSTSHGRSRPSFIHRSLRPYDIDAFQPVAARWQNPGGESTPVDNFSYLQMATVPDGGFVGCFTRYRDPAIRTLFTLRSRDGMVWEQRRLAAIEEGHYQISTFQHGRLATAFNMHPAGKGLNWRTNLYYMASDDLGETWHSADGRRLELPLTAAHNPALVHDYQAEGRNVYLKDIQLDDAGRPVILYLTSGGYRPGPEDGPRIWHTARWTGSDWEIRPVFQSDSNYDMGSLYLEAPDQWRIIAPALPGPQPYNPGGEVGMWLSHDQGRSWTLARQITHHSPYNHTYVRRPLQAHPGFYALWADGHGRQPSPSRLYFCDQDGQAYRLPPVMDDAVAMPLPLPPEDAALPPPR